MSGAVTIHMMSVNIYIYMETLGCLDINIDIRYKLRVNSAFFRLICVYKCCINICLLRIYLHL